MTASAASDEFTMLRLLWCAIISTPLTRNVTELFKFDENDDPRRTNEDEVVIVTFESTTQTYTVVPIRVNTGAEVAFSMLLRFVTTMLVRGGKLPWRSRPPLLLTRFAKMTVNDVKFEAAPPSRTIVPPLPTIELEITSDI